MTKDKNFINRRLNYISSICNYVQYNVTFNDDKDIDAVDIIINKLLSKSYDHNSYDDTLITF